MIALIISTFFSALRMSTPLTFSVLGGYCSERSGVVNIALEGKMLMGAFVAAAVASATHNPWLGVLGGIVGALSMAIVHGILCITYRGDQIISGIAVNLLAMGVPPVICKALYGQSSGSPMLNATDRIPEIFGISPLVLLSFISLGLMIFFHHKTKLGQYVRFAGEHPEALASQGINVSKIRWIAVLLAGVFCGFAGAYLSMDHGSGFSRGMTAGRGYIALAALIIGNWKPLGGFLAALIFGLIESIQILLQGFKFASGETMPVQWIQMVPYLATLVILAGLFGKKIGKSRPPSALGIPLSSIGILFLFSSMLTGCTVIDSVKNALHLNSKPNADETNVDPAQAAMNQQMVQAEFIKELFSTVLLRAPTKDEFDNYLNALSQNAHFEGLYNGLVYGTEYKLKEKGKASPGALKIFSEILAQLKCDQKYDIDNQENLEKASKPDVIKPDEKNSVAPLATPTEAEKLALVSEYREQALDFSFFSMKRILGEELIRTADLKKDYREKFSTWFGKIAVLTNSYQINFGLSERNNKDEYFHYHWALNADEDRIKWETLVRIHKLMNSKY